MGKNLLIVESPAKVKTIHKVLGKDYAVMASYGHVRDLPGKDGSVDTDHDFAMRYEVIDRNERHVDAIAKAARDAETIFLATDLDREGEAISWHLVEILRSRRLLKDKALKRVTFAEITPKAIKEAMAHPRDLSMDLVNAQQARRALDYLVGFNLSPLLWRKVQRGLSAGRVQSPALRMIVEREEEIERFVAREYWTLEADCVAAQPFGTKLIQLDGQRLDQFDINNQARAEEVRARLLAGAALHRAGGGLKVSDVQRKDRQRRPAPPFITSTLQQEAARKLGFGTQRTMRIAQQLYEGVDIGEGAPVGLISYMRTDSVNLSNDALAELREVIVREYGADKLPPGPQHYKSKSKNAQEAHEAIRPSSPLRTPASLARHLAADQLKLYELIWKRAVACQMKPALLNTVSVDLEARPGDVFRASGTTVVEPGFLAVYEEGRDQKDDEESGAKLPPLAVGQIVELAALRAEQHFTEPPPRYSEASLVKALEEYGIGRPSTYASIIQVLLAREYVALEKGRFHPSDVGRVVSKFLSGHFPQYVDYEFTARLEDELDSVARGEKDWVPVLREFWTPFKQLVDDKTTSVSRSEVTQGRVLGSDPDSGREVSVRLGRYGPFVQIGNKDEDEKLRFASLRAGQKMDTISLQEALDLFKLPRQLGLNAQGEEVSVGIGRFGPFAKAGSTYASLDKGEDPFAVDLVRAIELIEAKRHAAANRVILSFRDGAIQVLRGKFGPYITDGSKNAKIPKELEPEQLSEADCVAALEAAPAKSGKGRFARKGKNGKADSAAAKPAKARSAAKPASKAKAPAKAKTAPKAKASAETSGKRSPAKKTVAKKAVAKKPAASKRKAA